MDPDWREDPLAPQLFALGEVTEMSAMMESALRSVFCALIESKYAAIVAGGQSLTWLLENCRALVKANLEMTPKQVADIDAALNACKAANERRNALVHSRSLPGFSDLIERARSRRRTDVLNIEQWTPDSIHEVGYQLFYATSLLIAAAQKAIDSEGMRMDSALARERKPRQ